jgi:hypothetical protein
MVKSRTVLIVVLSLLTSTATSTQLSATAPSTKSADIQRCDFEGINFHRDLDYRYGDVIRPTIWGQYCGNVITGIVEIVNQSKPWLSYQFELERMEELPVCDSAYWCYKLGFFRYKSLNLATVPAGRYMLNARGFDSDVHNEYSWNCDGTVLDVIGPDKCRPDAYNRLFFVNRSSGLETPPPTMSRSVAIRSDNYVGPRVGGTGARVTYTAQLECSTLCGKLQSRYNVRLCKVGTSFVHSSCGPNSALTAIGRTPIKVSGGTLNYYQASVTIGAKATPGKYKAYVFKTGSKKPIDVAGKQQTVSWTTEAVEPVRGEPGNVPEIRSCSWAHPNGGVSVTSAGQYGSKVRATVVAESCYTEPVPTRVLLVNSTTGKSVTMKNLGVSVAEMGTLGVQTTYTYEAVVSAKIAPAGMYDVKSFMPVPLEDEHLLAQLTTKAQRIKLAYGKNLPATTVPTTVPTTATTTPGATETTIPSTGTTTPGTSVTTLPGSTPTTTPPTTTTPTLPDVSTVVLTSDEFRSGSTASNMGDVLTTVSKPAGQALLVGYRVTLRCSQACGGSLPDTISAKICAAGNTYNGSCKSAVTMTAYSTIDANFSRSYYHYWFDAGSTSGSSQVNVKVTTSRGTFYPTPLARLVRTY